MTQRPTKAVQDLAAWGCLVDWAHHTTFPGLLFLLEPGGGAAAGRQLSKQEL